MKKYSICVLLLIALCSFASAKKSRPESTARYWEMGVAAARGGQPDSALHLLNTVLSKGIAEDSLYYLWAEIYLNRGVIDTALVLNLSIKPGGGSTIRKLTYEQRYLIYTTLGWKKEAEAALDSTMQSTVSGPLGWLIPECALYLSGGGYFENNVVDRKYPYPASEGTMETLKNGSALGALRLEWKVSALKKQQLNVGTRLRYSSSRFSLAARTAHQNDSADAAVGGYIKYGLFSNALSFTYMISRKRDFLDEQSVVHLASLRYALLGKKWLGSVEGGYQYDTNDKEHYGYLLGWGDRLVGKSDDFSGELFFSGVRAAPYLIADIFGVVNVKDNVRYTDTVRQGVLKFTGTPLVFFTQIPVSYLNAATMVRWEHKTDTRFSFGGGAGYSATRYTQHYKWYYLLNSKPSGSMGDGFALNVVDGKYYVIESANLSGGVKLSPDPVHFEFVSKERIDQTITMNLFFKRSFEAFGDGTVDLNVRRNFSTLMKDAPVDIQQWYGELLFSWFFRYAPGRG